MPNKKRVSSAVIACALALAVFCQAKADAPQRIDIPAGDLVTALESLAKQADIELVFRATELKGLKTDGVTGTYALKDAMALLLKGTSLTFHTDSSGAMLIQKGQKSTSTEMSPSDQMRVAMTVESDAQKKQAASGESKDAPQMVVEGERQRPAPFSTANLDLTRTEDDVLPFTVFTARDIELSGAGNLQEFFQRRLPQNFNTDIPKELNGLGLNPALNANRVDLRGWGAAETVFLLNGRPMSLEFVGVSGDGDNATPNLDQIPFDSIDRIEILTSAGSAIYGENATGGVINIITRRDYSGSKLHVGYETPADVSRPSRSINFSLGAPLAFGFGLQLNAGYGDSESALVGDRADVGLERWRRLAMERDPLQITGQYSAPLGATPNILSASFEPLFGPDSPVFTSVPNGYAGGSGLIPFTQRQGIYNLELADAGTSSLADRSAPFGPAEEKTIVALELNRNFGERWQWSLEGNFGQVKREGLPQAGELSFASYPGSGNSETLVPAAAPGNPFGQDVAVSMIDSRLQHPELRNGYKQTSYRVGSVLRGEFGQWRGYLDARYSHYDDTVFGDDYIEPIGGWNNAFLSGAYNPFVDPRTTAPAAADFYSHYVLLHNFMESANEQTRVGMRFSGLIFQLPAGAVQLTFGGDWIDAKRTTSYYINQYQDSLTRAPVVPTEAPDSIQDEDENPARRFSAITYSLVAEANVPLVSASQGLPGVKLLEAFVSGNLSSTERKSESSPVTYNPKPHVYAFGLRYEPVVDVALRASRSLGFRPANVGYFTPGNSFGEFVFDPVRNQGVFLAPNAVLTGGNLDLAPEETAATNVGFIFTPRRLRGLRLSVDYLEEVRDNAIVQLSPYQLVQFVSQFPDKVKRGAPDAHPSGVGPIIFVDARATNLFQMASKSLDFSLNQTIENVRGGRLLLGLRATKSLSFKIQTSVDLPPVEQVRNPDGLNTQATQWNGNAQLQWEGKNWTFGWSTRYLDVVTIPVYTYTLQGGDHLGSALNHDVFFSYRAPTVQEPKGMQHLFSGTTVNFGIKDVFDREPRFWALDGQRGIGPGESVMGRTVWLRASREF